MNGGPYKLHTGYLVEGLELFIRKVAYTKYEGKVSVASKAVGLTVVSTHDLKIIASINKGFVLSRFPFYSNREGKLMQYVFFIHKILQT
jgi:hypothetical protein